MSTYRITIERKVELIGFEVWEILTVTTDPPQVTDEEGGVRNPQLLRAGLAIADALDAADLDLSPDLRPPVSQPHGAVKCAKV